MEGCGQRRAPSQVLPGALCWLLWGGQAVSEGGSWDQADRLGGPGGGRWAEAEDSGKILVASADHDRHRGDEEGRGGLR